MLQLGIFNGPGALVDFVNANEIAQDSIVKIKERNGKWYLFYIVRP